MAHTLGAASAAFKIMKLVAGVSQDKTRKGMSSSEMAEIISRETRDAEMLNMLKDMIDYYESGDHSENAENYPNDHCPICRAEALIAKVEGR